VNRYYFSVDITGYKCYAVEAESVEDAVDMMNNHSDKYLVEDCTDMDLGWGISKKTLEDCIEDIEEIGSE